MNDAESDRCEGERAHGGSVKELGEAATLPAPAPSVAGPGLPAPSLGGVVEVAERDRVFEALFQVPAERQRLGRYVVLGTLGRGAMGTVLEAFDRTLDRRVAVKMLHGDLSERHRQRLLREAQALAKLSHPNVVQVYEVGEADGQVFIAMELVRGQSLWKWMQQQPRSGWRECVKVYLQAGKGLAAAHGEGLVHRDFKPGNAVIDDKGRVRVLDFGLARHGEDGEQGDRARTRDDAGVEETALASPLTQTGAVLGTPAYMPLEQMEGRQADARSDQFGFCVALYEALHGERPFEGSSMEALMLALRVGKVRPVPKGTVVPEALRKVVIRGLATEPGERWPSMEALLAELRRLVTPRRRGYWALGVTAGLAAMGVGLWQYAEVGFRCEGAEAQLAGVWDDQRKQEVKTAILGTDLVYAPGTWERVEQRIDDFADDWMEKHTEVCEATRVTEEQTEGVMELRMGCLRERRTAARAAVDVLAEADEQVVENAVELVAGLPLLTRCDDVELLEQQRQRMPPPEDPQVGQEVDALRERLADVKAEKEAGKYARALEHIQPVLERAEALGYGPLLAEAKYRCGWLFSYEGQYTEAEQELTEAYALALEHEHGEVALHSAQMLVFVVGYQQARPAEGLMWGHTAVPLAERNGDAVEQATSSGMLGSVLLRRGEYEQAKLHYQRALQILEKVHGAEHPEVANALASLGTLLASRGEYEQAKLHHQRALQILENAQGPDHPEVATSLNNLGNVFGVQGDHEQAKLHYQRALQIREQAQGIDHPEVATSLNNLGNVFGMQGDHEQATLHYQRALQIREKALGADHPLVADTLTNLGIELESQGQYEQAELDYQQALQILEKALGADHPNLAYPLLGLAAVAFAQTRFEAARAHTERAVSILAASNTPPELLAEARFLLARALWPDGSERARSRILAEQARDAYSKAGKGHEDDLVKAIAWLAEHEIER